MSTVEILGDLEGLVSPSHALDNGGPATIIRVRTRIVGLPVGQALELPFSLDAARRLRHAWLFASAAYLTIIGAVVAAADFAAFLLREDDDASHDLVNTGILASAIILSAVTMAILHVPQHPVRRLRSRRICFSMVNKTAADEWCDLNPGRLSIR